MSAFICSAIEAAMGQVGATGEAGITAALIAARIKEDRQS